MSPLTRAFVFHRSYNLGFVSISRGHHVVANAQTKNVPLHHQDLERRGCKWDYHFFCWGLTVPSRELTYPPKMAYLKMIFLFPRWDMLVFRGLTVTKINACRPAYVFASICISTVFCHFSGCIGCCVTRPVFVSLLVLAAELFFSGCCGHGCDLCLPL